jgi:Holliday junction resolvase RusA-like endonuclease
MTEPVRIVVEGPPVGKGRPRFVRATGHTYTPERTANYEAILGWEARAAMNGRPPLDGAVGVDIKVFMPIPSRWSKKKQQAAASGFLRPTGRPDLDNQVKLIDGLNGVVWRDDGQIVTLKALKWYSYQPRLEIEVREVA